MVMRGWNEWIAITIVAPMSGELFYWMECRWTWQNLGWRMCVRASSRKCVKKVETPDWIHSQCMWYEKSTTCSLEWPAKRSLGTRTKTIATNSYCIFFSIRSSTKEKGTSARSPNPIAENSWFTTTIYVFLSSLRLPIKAHTVRVRRFWSITPFTN